MSYRDSKYLVELFDFDLLHLQLNTPIFIGVLVLLVVWLINRWWFRPVLRSLDARGALLQKWQADSQSDANKTEKLLADYERNLAKVRLELDALRNEGLKQCRTEADQLLDQARTDAKQELEITRSAIKKQLELARKELPQRANQLAEQICERLLRA